MELTRINLRAVADNCALLMQGLVEERGVNLSVVGEAPDVMGNADALNQIFVNLIENASRFAGEGGHVRVEITCSEGHSVIAVKDDGPGFGDESPDHLFDRFYRADQSRARFKGSGNSGLGLAIVKALTEAMGGTVAGGEPSRSRGGLHRRHSQSSSRELEGHRPLCASERDARRSPRYGRIVLSDARRSRMRKRRWYMAAFAVPMCSTQI